jgi:hypothetical protein
MPSIGSLLTSRLLPVITILCFAYVVPWVQRTYLLFGYSGKNFQQSDVSNCQVIHPDTLIGCEDLHVYQAASGPMIFTGCVNSLMDQLVLSNVDRLI